MGALCPNQIADKNGPNGKQNVAALAFALNGRPDDGAGTINGTGRTVKCLPSVIRGKAYKSDRNRQAAVG